VSFARLDGSGGGDLNTTGATVATPSGVALDLAARRLYWANEDADKISFASLDGAGGGDLPTTGATVKIPSGIAVDAAGGRVFWANRGADKISFARLDGTGGGDLNTTGATIRLPAGVAIDVDAGRVLWANRGDGASDDAHMSISFARLDGSGGGDVVRSDGRGGAANAGKAAMYAPQFPALAKRPVGTAPPTISGGTALGSTLTCSDGTWAPDLTGAFLFRAPQTLAYAWTRDGAAVTGASSRTLAATQAGSYRCTVTATNFAGATPQTSQPDVVGGGTAQPGTATPTVGPTTLAARVTYVGVRRSTLTLRTNMKGTLTVRSPRGQFRSVRRTVAAGNVAITLQLRPAAGNRLRRNGRLSVAVVATLKPGDGIQAGTLKRTIVLRLV
jgi:hypothetical protein